ncbi:helix-turn-helix domain-containing protein [Patescibacteria group bacterium]|nr:helix-turn-helix domain-containing protein [Patescibacteria group bacterium]MCG2695132.1 helix-turn-helix domain-containing protein [Candidatus Parcubacteria bacterium]
MDNSIYTKEYKNLTEKIRQARIDSKLDQIEVAKRLKRTQSYVSKMESGQIRIDIIQLKQLAKIYKKSLDFFVK